MILFKKQRTEKINNYSYYRVYNLFSSNERNYLINLIDPKLKYYDNYPVPQTPPDLHLNLNFKPFLKTFEKHIFSYLNSDYYFIDKCWSVFTDGSDAEWHIDNADYTAIFFLKNKNPKNGTFIQINEKEHVIKGYQNSLIIHKSNILHRSPITKNKINRYVITFAIKKYWKGVRVV